MAFRFFAVFSVLHGGSVHHKMLKPLGQANKVLQFELNFITIKGMNENRRTFYVDYR